MTRIKICGITNPFDARLAVHAGADALGLLFAQSVRRITVAQAREIVEVVPPLVSCIAVFMDSSTETIRGICRQLGIRTVQLHGMESPEQVGELRREFKVIKGVHLTADSEIDKLAGFGADAYLVDSRSATGGGGTGRLCDWDLAAAAAARHVVVLAGGLSADNVADAIRSVQPYAVDASSLLEEAPGKKDPVLMRSFVEEVRRADRESTPSPDRN